MLSKDYKLFSKNALPALLKMSRTLLDPTPFVAAAHVFPMRLNNHVADDLIDWSNPQFDPMFRLSVPQPDMLRPHHLQLLLEAMSKPEVSRIGMRAISESIRQQLNPHPAGQKEENVPWIDGTRCHGLQHKYRETVLFFPSEGQYCHAYCTYCFRWAQFTAVGSAQAFKSSDSHGLVHYLNSHPNVADILFTGGDPMVMPTSALRKYMEPLLGPQGPPHLNTIRIGTKSLSWWPYRYLSDKDSSDLLRLFASIVQSGKHLSIQAHFSHYKELEHPAAREAIRLIRMTGAQIRSQAPLIRRVNDDPYIWERMWKLQAKLGIIPYYMFMERDTGARDYFSVPIVRASEIYRTAISRVPGTARTARGPSMSVNPGKIHVIGEAFVKGERCFALQFLQARNPEWCGRVFFAKFDPKATWLDELQPAFGEQKFFFEDEYDRQKQSVDRRSSGQLHDADWMTGSAGDAEDSNHLS